MEKNWVDEVLEFWFVELTPEDWYSGKGDLDDRIRDRFGPLYERLKSEIDVEAIDDPRTALAAVIVFDQFPRNMFRRSAAAFATDDMAAGVARRAVDAEFDSGLTPEQKQFLYMPFMHSEVTADQERCVDLFKTLANEEGLKYAVEHRDIVARFGRFPHRNRALGRDSTQDEIDFLKGHDGYGQ
ncbi:DUF924 family protein [Aquamicrobium sp. LC103]|uniref:DUF924 family protein n=1 Tax=Aquamicrobium sp. LC103 TaxID=1120658 RepID=UPI00063ED342|nr:DUF924 family protein [Aquamicrobium sp. LC103]TKT74258.1 DUF924 domain-containing protein [Aquamicrobium sp. LC103]